MNYAEAAKIRKTGLGELITNRIIEGKNASITRAISDKFAARSVGFKETFGLMNLAKVLTGGSNIAAAFMGRMTGAKPEDIRHVTGRKQITKSYMDSYGMNRGSSTMSNEVLEKMLNFMQQTQVKEEERLETLMTYEEFQSKLREDHHREVMEILLKATLNKRKAEKQMKAETKKREQLERDKKAMRTEKMEVPSAPAPKAPAPAPKAPAPKPTTAPKAPTPAPKPAPAPKPTPSVQAPVPRPATPTAPAPSIPSAVGKTATREATKQAAKTAAKVSIGAAATVAGISAAAAFTIKGETGVNADKAIQKVGQIVPNDPKPGVTSYGILGINSGGSVQLFVRDNPQFTLTAKPASKEFDEQWLRASKDKPDEMLKAQLQWYEKYVEGPIRKDISKIVPAKFATDSVMVYLSDRRNQYGKAMEGQAISYASTANNSKEFIQKITEFDIDNIDKAFKTYLSNHPKNAPGLIKRIRSRQQYANSIEAKMLTQDNVSGSQLNADSSENVSLKKEMGNSGAPVVIIENTNNTSQKTTNNTSVPHNNVNPRLRR
jgi:hypothetical protein